MAHVITETDRTPIDEIRFLLSVYIREAELATDVILSDVFLRSAELELYSFLGLDGDDMFDAMIGSDPRNNFQTEYRERSMLAVQYLTAIKLIPNLPQLLEESILRERVRYQDINWKEKIEHYRESIFRLLEPIAPEGNLTDLRAIFDEVDQYVAF